MTAPNTAVQQSRPPKYAIEKRQGCEQLRASLWSARSSFDALWREQGQYILPGRVQFSTSDTNRGEKRNQSIIDSTATEAAGTCAAGMHSGVTNPAKPWFRLTVADPDLAENDEVKEYLHVVETRMQAAMLKSNYYKVLPLMYLDLCVFGTSAFSIVDDDRTIFRCYDFTLGTYAIANDDRREVRTFVRMFRLTVGQVVQRWGNIDASGIPDFQRGQPSAISIAVQELWKRQNTEAWVDLVHVIQPNVSYDGIKIESQYKRYEEIYYEFGTTSGTHPKGEVGILAHSGYDEFPVIVARWEKSGEDVYGTNCPGRAVLGDVKQLQLGEKRSAQAVEKMVNPPLVGPPELMNAKVSVLPGDLTYSTARDANNGLRPIYQVTFDVQKLEMKQEQLRQRIRGVMKADLFLMLSQSDRTKTATEVDELKEEKLLAIGPVLGQLNEDVLDPSIDRIFGLMARKGLFPDPPDVLQGQDVRVEYVSIAALAQRIVGLSAIERTLSFAGQAAQIAPDSIDVIDMDQLMREHVEAGGSPPKVVRSEDTVQQIRTQRQQQQAQQQAAENMPKLAGAAAALGKTPNDPSSILGSILGKRNATATLNATQQPPTVQ